MIIEEVNMIKSKKELKFYLEADKIALDISHKRPNLIGDRIWKYQRCLRKVEYYKNTQKSNLFKKILYYYYRLRLEQLFVKTGFHISPNVCGPGLSLAHEGSVGININAKVGENCRIHIGSNIGAVAGSKKAPVIGNNVYIGPGAKIFGEIYIADGIAIGANAVVNKSFEEPNITIGGIPAKKISNKGSKGLLIEATTILNERINRL